MDTSAVAEYIERRDYEALVEIIQQTEFSKTDRLYVIKYLKRINAFNSLKKLSQIKLSISAGDFSVFQQEKFDKDIAYPIYYCLFNTCSSKDIIGNVPINFTKQNDFVLVLLQSEKVVDNVLIDWLWDGCNMQDCINNSQDFLSYEFEKTPPTIIFRHFIYKSVHFLGKIYNLCKADTNKMSYFKQILKQHFYESARCADDVVCFVSRCVNLNDVFSERCLKYYFENSCLTNNPALVSAILECGFNQITAGFNVTVRSNNFDLVKMILPYKPRLDTAIKMQGCSLEIYALLDLAVQSKRKKKSKKNAT